MITKDRIDMLTRLGNKSKIARLIYPYFPPHKMRIELFFGAGGAYFNMPRTKYHILNDLDDDVTNLYELVLHDRPRLTAAIEQMPITASLVSKWKPLQFSDPLQKALRFLLLSNFTYLGKGDTLRLGIDNTKEVMLAKVDEVFTSLRNAKITNTDFREVIPKISFTRSLCDRKDAFVYLDPVYLDTEHFYKVPKWTVEDTVDCFELMANEGIRAAMSEFDHPIILTEAAKRGFAVVPIKERSNIKNRRTEVLILNYQPPGYLF